MRIGETAHARSRTAITFDLCVQEQGRVELDVPFPTGTPIVVFVLPLQDQFADLLSASHSSLDFWDNPYDDEDWNES